MTEKKYPVKRKKEYEFNIDKLAFGGAGVAKVDNYVIFIKDTLPGDRVIARITKRKQNFAEARLISIVEKSPLRLSAPCSYFEWCGGCTWQNMAYENQLDYKRQIVSESLRHIAGIPDPAVETVLPSDNIFAYRNKMEFSFSDRRWLLPDELGVEDISKDFALGLHIPGTFDKILQIDRCLLQSDTANAILQTVNLYAREHGLKPYGLKSHEGFLRFLVIRESSFNHEIMVNIVTGYEDVKSLQPLADKLMTDYPQVKSVVNNINTRRAQIAAGEKEYLLAGKALIKEKLGSFDFNISANSFFQTNTVQAEKLYDQIMGMAGLQGNEIVWDLYSGTGTISMFLAQRAKEVIGLELVDAAVADALQNVRDHDVKNVRFVSGDLLHKLREVQPLPDVLVADPPRAGMHEKVVRFINQINPKRVVYVSCNPTTLARDLAILKEKYRIEKVQPVDMFPQTYHIETVVKLTRK